MVQVPAIVVALNEQQRSGVDGNGIRGRGGSERVDSDDDESQSPHECLRVNVSVESPSTLFIEMEEANAGRPATEFPGQ